MQKKLKGGKSEIYTPFNFFPQSTDLALYLLIFFYSLFKERRLFMKRLMAEIRKANRLGISYGRFKAIQLEKARKIIRTPQDNAPDQKGKKSNGK